MASKPVEITKQPQRDMSEFCRCRNFEGNFVGICSYHCAEAILGHGPPSADPDRGRDRPSPKLLAKSLALLHLAPPAAPSNTTIYPFLDQPPEIIMCIADHLPPESVVALALTCKELWPMLIPLARLRFAGNAEESKNFPHYTSWEWGGVLERFLQLLEKDMGDTHFYCEVCKKLHPFDSNWTANTEFGGKKRFPCDSKTGQNLRLSTLHIPYRMVRLIMNRHRFGPPNGIDSSVLNMSYRLKNYEPGPIRERMEWNVHWQARILGGGLYLHGTHTLLDTKGENTDLSVLKQGLTSMRHDLCAHINTYEVYSVAHWHFVPRWLGILKRSCRRCLTDWVFELQLPRNGEKSYNVVVKTYHLLGAGRSPFDPLWRCTVGDSTMNPGYERNLSVKPLGSVAASWLESDEEGKKD